LDRKGEGAKGRSVRKEDKAAGHFLGFIGFIWVGSFSADTKIFHGERVRKKSCRKKCKEGSRQRAERQMMNGEGVWVGERRLGLASEDFG
jgi:hypothetical protein